MRGRPGIASPATTTWDDGRTSSSATVGGSGAATAGFAARPTVRYSERAVERRLRALRSRDDLHHRHCPGLGPRIGRASAVARRPACSDAAAGRQGKPACGRDATVQGCCRTAIRPTGSASFHRADVIVEASDRGGELCYVAVEVSYTVNGTDSSRAIRNAGLLTRFTGCRSYAVVAGLRRDDRIQDRVDAGEVFWCDTDTPAYGAGIVIRRPACSRTGRSRTPWRPESCPTRRPGSSGWPTRRPIYGAVR